MKWQTKTLVAGSITAFVGTLSPATVFATGGAGTCYAVTAFDHATTVDGGPPLIVRYLTDNEGSINSNAEVRNFYHLKQQAYSLVGKGTALFNVRNGDQCQAEPCANTEPNGHQVRIMTTLDGTIITGKEDYKYRSPDEPGAHMGLDLQFVRFVDGFPSPAIGPITLECSSEEATTTPKFWFCNVKAELQGVISPVFALTLPIGLEKVNPLDVPACSVFQDGGGALPIIPNNNG